MRSIRPGALAPFFLFGALLLSGCEDTTGPDDIGDESATPVEASSVAVGVTHACGIDGDGKTYCWGNNSYGLLGSGQTDLVPHASPQAVVTGVQFTSIGSQGGYTCGLTAAGQVYCWGVDRGGSLGSTGTQGCNGEIGPQPCSTVPIPINSTQLFTRIGVMWSHACAITADGRTFCWGNNNRGQAGPSGITGSNSTPVLVSSSLRFSSVTGGDQHTCAISSADQRVHCWGDNRAGQLGLGTADATVRSTPSPVNSNLSFRMISGHGQDGGHTCGIATDDKTYCWGSNNYGQLGLGSATSVSLPTPVATSLVFKMVAAGYNWTCGLTQEGRAHCWGAASGTIPGSTQSCNGPAGLQSCTTTPMAVAPQLRFVTLRLGASSACGVTSVGRVYCWGKNDTGKLGNGTIVDNATPTLLSGTLTFPVPGV